MDIEQEAKDLCEQCQNGASISDVMEIVGRIAEHSAAAERHDCEIAVWLVRMEAEKPDAPDEGVSGWLQEAEGRIRLRSNVQSKWRAACGTSKRQQGAV